MEKKRDVVFKCGKERRREEGEKRGEHTLSTQCARDETMHAPSQCVHSMPGHTLVEPLCHQVIGI